MASRNVTFSLSGPMTQREPSVDPSVTRDLTLAYAALLVAGIFIAIVSSAGLVLGTAALESGPAAGL